MLLSVLLLTELMQLVISMWLGVNKLWKTSETDAVWSRMSQVVSEDIHQGEDATVYGQVFKLTVAGGGENRYWVNDKNEYVRVGSSGGTAVLAVHVAAVEVKVTNHSLVRLTVTFEDGTSKEMEACLLSQMMR